MWLWMMPGIAIGTAPGLGADPPAGLPTFRR
jgi:hypothetical protein